MRKRPLIICIAVIFIFIILSFILYVPSLFQEGNPIPILQSIIRLQLSNEKISAISNNPERYITKTKGGDDALILLMKSKEWIFKDQLGAGFVFENKNNSLIVTCRQYSKYFTMWTIANPVVKDNKQLEAAIIEYYSSNQPENEGVLKIYNIKKYGNGYLVLTEKYRGEGEGYSDLFLIDNNFKIIAAAQGNIPISPCFSANVVKDQGKSIVYGNFKNKKWEPEIDTVVDVQIDMVKVTFEDGTVIKESVSMDKGYIVIVETVSKIKNIEVYNKKEELQSDLSETFSQKYSFRWVDGKSGYQKNDLKLQTDETEGNTSLQQKTDNIVEEIIDNYIPRIFNPIVHSYGLEYKSKWKGNVMPGFVQEMKKIGWEELINEQMGAMQYFRKEIHGQQIKISILPQEQGGPEEKNAVTLVIVKLESLHDINILSDEAQKALKVVQDYFNAFSKADYKTMSTLATESHNKKLIHDGDVWGMKWAKAKEIKLVGNPKFLRIENLESTIVFSVSVDMETVKTSAQYPSTQTGFYTVLVKGEDGIWRVDGFTTG